MLMQSRGCLEFLNHGTGKLHRKRLGLALSEINKNVGDVVGLGGEIYAGNDIGLVFWLGQPRPLGVRNIFWERKDRPPPRPPLPAPRSVDVERKKKCSTPGARKSHPFSKRNESVFRTSHRNPIPAPTFQLLAKGLREGEHDIFFKFAA